MLQALAAEVYLQRGVRLQEKVLDKEKWGNSAEESTAAAPGGKLAPFKAATFSGSREKGVSQDKAIYNTKLHCLGQLLKQLEHFYIDLKTLFHTPEVTTGPGSASSALCGGD